MGIGLSPPSRSAEIASAIEQLARFDEGVKFIHRSHLYCADTLAQAIRCELIRSVQPTGDHDVMQCVQRTALEAGDALGFFGNDERSLSRG